MLVCRRILVALLVSTGGVFFATGRWRMLPSLIVLVMEKSERKKESVLGCASVGMMEERGVGGEGSRSLPHTNSYLHSKRQQLRKMRENRHSGALEPEDQELEVKDMELAATLGSKDEKIAVLEAALKNSKPMHLMWI